MTALPGEGARRRQQPRRAESETSGLGGGVQGGRGHLLLDLTAAHISMKRHGAAMQAFAEIETNGDPIIRITPLWIAGEPDHSKDIPLPAETSLLVLNQGLECGNETEEGNFDFMLQFLTASGGIPGSLKEYRLAGRMTAWRRAIRPRASRSCESTDIPTRQVRRARPAAEIIEVGVRISCSDSRYP